MAHNEVVTLERKIRALAASDRAALFEQIDDLFDAEWALHARQAREAAASQGIDPNDAASVQQLVDSVRYPHSTRPPG